MLTRLIKPVFMVCAVFITVWVIVVVYWNFTARMPSTSDILLYLIVLPLALVVFYVVLRRIFTGAPTAAALPSAARGASVAMAGVGACLRSSHAARQ
jgi:hypothetical protein